MEAQIALVTAEMRRLQAAESSVQPQRTENSSVGRAAHLEEQLNILIQQRLQHLETIQCQQIQLQVKMTCRCRIWILFLFSFVLLLLIFYLILYYFVIVLLCIYFCFIFDLFHFILFCFSLHFLFVLFIFSLLVLVKKYYTKAFMIRFSTLEIYLLL